MILQRKKSWKKIAIKTLTIFFLMGIFALPIATHAEACFKTSSGLGFEATTCDDGTLLADFIVQLNIFFFRLAIVLAVLMITIGGFQWLMAIGNASKISAAKETIQQAVIGLILAATAFLLFSQIDTSFVELEKLSLLPSTLESKCGKFLDKNSCNLGQDFERIKCTWNCVEADTKNPDVCCISADSLGPDSLGECNCDNVGSTPIKKCSTKNQVRPKRCKLQTLTTPSKSGIGYSTKVLTARCIPTGESYIVSFESQPVCAYGQSGEVCRVDDDCDKNLSSKPKCIKTSDPVGKCQ